MRKFYKALVRGIRCFVREDQNQEDQKDQRQDLDQEDQKQRQSLIQENQTPMFIDYNDTCIFIPPITNGQVIKVYDGDTITIASTLPYPESPLYRFQVRLNGIDCPEIKSKNEDEKEIAIIARKEIENLVMDKIVTLKNLQNEKYGRILADVYIEDIHLNSHLLSKKLAVVYSGQTKQSPQNWKKYYFTGQYD